MECHSIAPDFGTESKTTRVMPVKARVVLPHFSEPGSSGAAGGQAQQADFSDSDADAGAADFTDDERDKRDNGEDVMLEFDRMLLNPGTIHITHNAANTLEHTMESFDTRFPQLKRVCELCRTSRHRPRFIASCLNDPAGRLLAKQLQGFRGAPRKERFASIAFAIPWARNVEVMVRKRWNAEAFLAHKRCYSKRGRRKVNDDANDDMEEAQVFVKEVTEAISEPEFWAWLVVADKVSDVIRFSMTFLTSCSCHWALHKSLLRADKTWEPQELARRKQLWALVEDCPGRGRRCTDLSTGLLFKDLAEEEASAGGQLLGQLPADIDAKQKKRLVQEFHSGIAGLKFNLRFKLHSYQEEPAIIYRLGHPSQDLAIDAMRTVLASSDRHFRVLEFQCQPVRRQAMSFINGDKLYCNDELDEGMRELATLIGAAVFAFSSEWRGEGEHALTKWHTRTKK